jgi:phosphoesterase RecJ-like protein
VHDDVPGALLPVIGAALATAVLEPDAFGGLGLVRAVVSRESREAAGLSVAEVAPVLDTVRRPREADVAVLLVGETPTSWKVSLRSKGGLDVSRAAVALGGGGHRMAAGASLSGSLAEAELATRRALEAAAAR